MRIVAVIGSPRGLGAGYRIITKIEHRMKELGLVDFTYLFLKDANLRACLGCYTCMKKGEDKCPLHDDCDAIEQELQAADGIILSSPVHVNNVSWLMKNFIDRFAFMNHRPKLLRQKVLNVVNMSGPVAGETLAALRVAIGGARGNREVHELAVSTPPWPQTPRAIARKERAIDAAASKFYRACLDTSLPAPTLGSCIDFLLMKRLYTECGAWLPADHAYYAGRSYYFETKLPWLPAHAAGAIVRLMLSVYFALGWGPGDVLWPVPASDRHPE